MGSHVTFDANLVEAVTPPRPQRLLLAAALLHGDSMTAAWTEWRSLVDFDGDLLEPATMRLLPLVYHNLAANGVQDPILGRLRGIHRRAWVNNQLQFAACARLLRIFHAAGIKTLVLKGAAVVTQFYPDHGARPMGDVDVLVPKRQAQAALDLLTEHGWRPTRMPRSRMTPTFTSVRHAQNFAGPDGNNLDLHWHIFIDHLDEETDALLWEAAIPHSVQQVATRRLNPTDQLLHVCVHGMSLLLTPRVGWIADAVMILRRAHATVDWTRLVELATRSYNTLYLRAAFGYLRGSFTAPIPDHVLAALTAAPVAPQEEALFRSFQKRDSIFGQLPLLWNRYRLARGRTSAGAGVFGFPGYLRIYHGKASLGEMAAWAASRARFRAGNFLHAQWQAWRAKQRPAR